MGSAPELISTSIISRSRKYLYPLGEQSIRSMCRDGVFKTAQKLGKGKKAHWFVLSSEVIAHKMNGRNNPFK